MACEILSHMGRDPHISQVSNVFHWVTISHVPIRDQPSNYTISPHTAPPAVAVLACFTQLGSSPQSELRGRRGVLAPATSTTFVVGRCSRPPTSGVCGLAVAAAPLASGGRWPSADLTSIGGGVSDRRIIWLRREAKEELST